MTPPDTSPERPGTTFIVEFWMSGSSPRWRIQGVGRTWGGHSDSRQDAIDGAVAKLTEWAREPWGDDA